MIVQACINGARSPDYHAALPLTPYAMAADAADCVAAGAAEIHLHVRDTEKHESLSPTAFDETILACRRRCPGTQIGVSTGAWIEADDDRTLAAIDGWTERPDYASVNLSEAAAPQVMERLTARGIGIEAGLASVADAERFVALDRGRPVLRILIEIGEQSIEEAMHVTGAIADVLDRSGIRRPILAHGMDETVWHFVRLAVERRWSAPRSRFSERSVAKPLSKAAPHNFPRVPFPPRGNG
ncbi:3-keto-5-aminohexanoate cleavage protein [Rhizobium sp. TRM95111]|uniref:3-keto-5-aminohexanoate cleavage protein n=1 Tax=Rhizobium alarense TaxID=2846851 RepID=UPI001F280ECF|nr:3-keto-5-aminohexanoate cleavage protein [Rhizobium alarense]MCF3641160.1 3-keto-5-aminohexanoate cleavage protein [Rhizobium alarense]